MTIKKFPAQEVFKRAAEVLDENDWTQGDYENRNAAGKLCFCAVGALRHAASEVAKTRQALSRIEMDNGLADFMSKKVLDNTSVIVWNDSGFRTKEDVIGAFNRAAELAGEHYDVELEVYEPEAY